MVWCELLLLEVGTLLTLVSRGPDIIEEEAPADGITDGFPSYHGIPDMPGVGCSGIRVGAWLSCCPGSGVGCRAPERLKGPVGTCNDPPEGLLTSSWLSSTGCILAEFLFIEFQIERVSSERDI